MRTSLSFSTFRLPTQIPQTVSTTCRVGNMSSDTATDSRSDEETEDWQPCRNWGSSMSDFQAKDEDTKDEYDKHFKWTEKEADKAAFKEMMQTSVFEDDANSVGEMELTEPLERRTILRRMKMGGSTYEDRQELHDNTPAAASKFKAAVAPLHSVKHVRSAPAHVEPSLSWGACSHRSRKRQRTSTKFARGRCRRPRPTLTTKGQSAAVDEGGAAAASAEQPHRPCEEATGTAGVAAFVDGTDQFHPTGGGRIRIGGRS